MSLSDSITNGICHSSGDLSVLKVKQFIKDLKEKFDSLSATEIINELAGTKLTSEDE